MIISQATNAVSERLVSNLRRIKDWLRTSMTQKRLNHCMILSVHKERTDDLVLVVVANDFCIVEKRNGGILLVIFSKRIFPGLQELEILVHVFSCT